MASLLKEQLGLELSETKTLITPVTKTFAFLGHHVVVRDNRGFKRKACVTLIPKEKSHRLRERIKRLRSRARSPRYAKLRIMGIMRSPELCGAPPSGTSHARSIPAFATPAASHNSVPDGDYDAVGGRLSGSPRAGQRGDGRR